MESELITAGIFDVFDPPELGTVSYRTAKKT